MIDPFRAKVSQSRCTIMCDARDAASLAAHDHALAVGMGACTQDRAASAINDFTRSIRRDKAATAVAQRKPGAINHWHNRNDRSCERQSLAEPIDHQLIGCDHSAQAAKPRASAS